MKIFKKSLAFLLLGVTLFQGVSVLATTPTMPSGVAYSEIGATIEAYVAEHEETTVGMDVSVFTKDEILYENYFGYANREEKIAVDEYTVMEWGSATKLLVWISVMQLYEQGKIDLEADVRTYLPEEFLTNLKYDDPITMMHLMNHNAGFQDGYTDLFVQDHDAIGTLEEALLRHEPEQIYKPGEVTAYSNWGVGLAGYIVERVSGESFDVYVKNHIFTPLGMDHSAISADLRDNPWVSEKRKELACYKADGTLIEDCFYYITLYPAGMCTSTLKDFARFGRELLNKDTVLFDNPETWQLLFTPSNYLGQTDIPSNYHGFWVLPYQVETVGHGGNTAGCSSYLLLDLESEVGVAVMTNQQNEEVYNYNMMELFFGEFSWTDYVGGEWSAPKGIYRAARTIKIGPTKPVALGFMGFEEDDDGLFLEDTCEEGTVVRAPYGDYLKVPLWVFILEIGMIFIWGVGVLVSSITLIVRMFRWIINKILRKKKPLVLGRWSGWMALAQVAVFVFAMVFAYNVIVYKVSATYVWMCVGFAGIMLAMTALTLFGVIKVKKEESSKKRCFYNWCTAIFGFATVANILYWNLFMWWKL